MRTALVTGAAHGSGALAAKRLAAAAWDVVAVDVDEVGLAGTALRSPNTHVRTCDVTDPGEVAGVVSAAGPLHRVVHAAVAGSAVPVLEQSPDEVERIARTNVLGTANVVRAALPGMLRRGTGELIICLPGTAGATAAAVSAYADELWREYGGRGVTIRCVHAGGDTPARAVLDAADRSLARPAREVHVHAGRRVVPLPGTRLPPSMNARRTA